jgi:opacity protein-like surface antigen
MNRNRLAVALFTVAFLIVAFAATAGAVPSLGSFEVNAGYAKSSTDFTGSNDVMGGGVSFGAGYFHGLGASTQWGVEASYDNLGSADWATTLASGTTSAGIFRVSPQFRVNFGAPVGPSFFAQGGPGYYNMSSTVSTSGVSTDFSEGKFGYNFGAGVGFPLAPKTKLNVQGQYNSVSTSGQSTNYLNFRAGLAFSL